MTDIVEQIDALAADEKCPNCGRQWHERPLSLAVAQMHDRGHIDYLTTGRRSPIVCDGSALIGPRRPPWEPEPPPERRDVVFGYSLSDLALMKSDWWKPNPIFEFVDQVSGYSYVEHFAPPSPPPIAAFHKAIAMQSMTDALATLLGLDDLKLDLGSWLLPDLDSPPAPIDCSDITELNIEFGPQHWTTEHTAAPTTLTTAVWQRWHLITAIDTHAPDAPGYDFTAYQTVITEKYPTTKKRRKK